MKNGIFCDRLSGTYFRSDIDEILNNIQKLETSINNKLYEDGAVLLTHYELLEALIDNIEFSENSFLRKRWYLYSYMLKRTSFIGIDMVVHYSRAVDGSIIGYLDFILPTIIY